MSILYVLSMYPKYTETFIQREITELKKQGRDVVIVSLKKSKEKSDNKVFYSNIFDYRILLANLYFIFKSPKTYFKMIYNTLSNLQIGSKDTFKQLYTIQKSILFAYILRKANINHVHSHFAKMATTSSYVIATLLKLNFTFTVHAFDIFERDFDGLMSLKLKESKTVVCISQYNVNYIKEHFINLAPHVKFEVIRCGMPSSEIGKKDTSFEGKLRIVSTGSLLEKKGHYYLICAVKELINEGYDIELDIIGNGPLRKSLNTLIGGIKEIRLLGQLNVEEVLKKVEKSHMFILASVNSHTGDRDGIPVSLMEAMAKGKIVVSTFVSGIPDLIKDNVNGFLVPERNIDALKEKILLVMREYNSLRIQNMSNLAISTIEESFTIEKNVELLKKVFESE